MQKFVRYGCFESSVIVKNIRGWAEKWKITRPFKESRLEVFTPLQEN